MKRLRIFDAIAVLLAAYLVVQLGNAWAARLLYPYDLEWMEGGMLAHAWRFAHGKAVYVEPGPDFIPYVYPPGYSFLLALMGKVVGLGYTLGRSVSLVGTLAASAAISFGVARHYGDRLAGVLGAVVFLGCYHASGAFYDLVRPDALYLGLLSWVIVLGMERSRRALTAAALLLCCAFFVKHNAAAFGFPIAFGIWARQGWRDGLRFGLVAAVPALIGTLVVQWLTGGHFLGYLIEVPSAHPTVWSRGYSGVPREMAGILPVAMVCIALWCVTSVRRWAPAIPNGPHVAVPVVLGGICAMGGSLLAQTPGIAPVAAGTSILAFGSIGACLAAGILCVGGSLVRRGENLDWVYGFGVGLVALYVSAMMRAHHGGFLNVLMHLHWVIAFGFGVTVAAVRAQGTGRLVSEALGLAMVCQLGWQLCWIDAGARRQFTVTAAAADGGTLKALLAFRPDYEQLMPTEDDRAAGDAIVATLREYEGPILSAYAPWLPVQAGFEPSFHLIALWDVAQHKKGPYRQQSKRIGQAARNHYWGAVVDGTKPMRFGVSGENGAYRVDQIVAPKGKVFSPKTGWRTRPHAILVPKN
jgi:hypothetical protein